MAPEFKMDMWKYFRVVHRYHDILDPMSATKFDELIELLRLEPGDSVLDIACGKGELLARLAARYGISGVGVDFSPYFAADAAQRLKERAPDADIEILNLDAARYTPDKPFDVAMCIGASWVFQGHKGTLSALKAMTKPGGLILTGEPFWLQDPDQGYLDAEGFTADMFGTHYGNVTTGEELGLVPLYTLVSNQDDWDRYETLKWYAAERFTAENPADDDVKEILERIEHERTAYLRWGRDTINWAIYIFRKPVSAS